MATLHGSPLPEDFKDGKELTADAFNAVKDYWIVDELPEDAEDGDVVFVIGDDPVGGGADLVGGVAGWSAITEVSGTTDLTTLQNNGIAPVGAKEDSEVTGTYNYTDSEGVEWRVAVWTDTNPATTKNIKTSGGLVDAVLCGGGGAWQSSAFGYNTGTTGSVNEGMFSIGASNNITVGSGSPGGAGAACYGGASTLGSIVANGGTFGAPNAGVNGTSWADITALTSSITGNPVRYGLASTTSGAPGTEFGQPGNGHNMRGGPGIVVVRAPKDAEQSWEPAPELPGIGGWATIESVTGNPTRYEYPAGNPEWVAFEWTDTSKTHTLTTQAGGLVDVLAVGGGGNGKSIGGVGFAGAPGEVAATLLNTSTTNSIVIGQGNVTFNTSSSLGSLRTLSTTNVYAGGGAPDPSYESDITGTTEKYAQPWNDKGTRPGSAGGSAVGQNPGFSGVVIVRVPAANDKTGGTGSTPASVVAAVDQAKETVKQTIKRNRSKK